MKLISILVTRSKACHVKTLHTILKLNILCVQNSVDHEIVYCRDDPFDKLSTIEQSMKIADRLFFIDFGIGVDQKSLEKCLEINESAGLVVYPGVKEGVDWDQFKAKVKAGSTEPTSQMGLTFDTVLGKKTAPNFYHVTSTDAKVWVMCPRTIVKQAKKKIKLRPPMFEYLREQGVKIYAYSAAKLVQTYTHECVSNILNAAFVKVN